MHENFKMLDRIQHQKSHYEHSTKSQSPVKKSELLINSKQIGFSPDKLNHEDYLGGHISTTRVLRLDTNSRGKVKNMSIESLTSSVDTNRIIDLKLQNNNTDAVS